MAVMGARSPSQVVTLLVATRVAWGAPGQSDLGPTPFSALGCARARAGDASWVFEAGSGKWPSCNLPVGGAGALMCADAHGRPDHSSIYVDMRGLPSRTGCFAWTTAECSIDLRRVSQIDFDIDLSDCDDVWTAPLWLKPFPWVPPGSTSGEIDFVEACPVGSYATNFGADGEKGEHQMTWASGRDIGGPKHFVMTLDDSAQVGSGGNLRTQICDLNRTSCVDKAYYLNFLDTVVSAKGLPASYPYVFVSDVWNGNAGDGGWSGCKARNSPNTTCRYAIMRLRVHSNDGRPMFDGKCAALNADSLAPSVGEARLSNDSLREENMMFA